MMRTSSSSSCTIASLVPLYRFLFSLNTAIILSSGIAPSKPAQDPTTVVALTEFSDSECRIFDTVRPPLENAHLTSVEVAERAIISHQLHRCHSRDDTPRADKKSRAIRDKGCLATSIATHYTIGSVTFGSGGVDNQSLIGSLKIIISVLKLFNLTKYLFLLDVSACCSGADL